MAVDRQLKRTILKVSGIAVYKCLDYFLTLSSIL